jgi:hypothetical protein
MKRGFANGLGVFFTMGALEVLVEPANRYYLMQLNEIAVAAFFGLVFAAFLAFLSLCICRRPVHGAARYLEACWAFCLP